MKPAATPSWSLPTTGCSGCPPAGDVQVGPTIDLMGFAVAAPGRYLASGHPGPGVDLAGTGPRTDRVGRPGASLWPLSSRASRTALPHRQPRRRPGLRRRHPAAQHGWMSAGGSRSRPRRPACRPDSSQVLATTEQGAAALHRRRQHLGTDPRGPASPARRLVTRWRRSHRRRSPRPGVDQPGPRPDLAAGRGPGCPAAGHGRRQHRPDGGSRVLVVTSSTIAESRDGDRPSPTSGLTPRPGCRAVRCAGRLKPVTPAARGRRPRSVGRPRRRHGSARASPRAGSTRPTRPCTPRRRPPAPPG